MVSHARGGGAHLPFWPSPPIPKNSDSENDAKYFAKSEGRGLAVHSCTRSRGTSVTASTVSYRMRGTSPDSDSQYPWIYSEQIHFKPPPAMMDLSSILPRSLCWDEVSSCWDPKKSKKQDHTESLSCYRDPNGTSSHAQREDYNPNPTSFCRIKKKTSAAKEIRRWTSPCPGEPIAA